MRKGEKLAIGLACAAIVGVLIGTFYLESRTSLKKKFSIAQSNQATGGAGQTRVLSALQRIPRAIDPEALPDPQQRGAMLLTTYCGQCHDLTPPTMHTADEWNNVLLRMRDHITQRRGGILGRIAMPTQKDWVVLQRYLEENALRALDTSSVSDLDSPAGRMFQKLCSRCHTTPDPNLHTVHEWPRVVLRMKAHMQNARLVLPDNHVIEESIRFLQAHGRP